MTAHFSAVPFARWVTGRVAKGRPVGGRARTAARVTLGLALVVGLGACSALVTDEERAARNGSTAQDTGASVHAPAFDLTTANLETRPHTEAIPAAVDALAASGFQPVQEGKLTVALFGAGGPPMSFFAEDDTVTLLGSDADFASLIAEGLGLEPALENVAWADWPLGIESGKYDLALININVTEERKELFDFASYREALVGFVVSADSEITEIGCTRRHRWPASD